MANAHEELIKCTEYLERFNSLRSIGEWVLTVEKSLEELLDVEYSGLYLYSEERASLELLVALGFTESERLEAERTAMQRHPGKVFSTGEELYVPDVLNDLEYQTTDSDRSFQVRTRLYHPIRVDGKTVGVFGAVSSKVDAFSIMERESFRFLVHLSATIYLRIRTEEANKELNRIKSRLSFIATHTHNMVIMTNRVGQIEWVNQSFESVTGYALHEVIGRRPGELLQRADADPTARSIMNKAIRNKEACHAQLINYRKNGEPYHADIQIYPIAEAGGEVSHFISLQRDITSEVLARDEIESSRNQLSAVISALPDQLLHVELVDLNDQSVVLQPLTIVSDRMLEFLNSETAQYRLYKAMFQSVQKSDAEPIEFELECLSTQCHFEARISPTHERKGILLIRNITTRKKLEAERNEHMIELEQALVDVKSRNDRLHNFSNVLSHNIRSHTSNISALIKLICMQSSFDDARRFLEVLERSSHHLDETIRSLNKTISLSLDPKFTKEPVVLSVLMKKIIDTLVVDIDQLNATIICDFNPEETIYADPVLLESILLNLITNSLKYHSAERSPEVTIRAQVMGENNVLKVIDNGMGIDMDVHGADLFGLFKTFNRDGRGRGIGLYLTKSQVESMGGRIQAESTVGEGSVFTVNLPKS